MATHLDKRPAAQPSRLDRRSERRMADPPCRICGASRDQVRVTTRTTHQIYFKCRKCKSVWSVQKPSSGSLMLWTPPRRK